MLMGRRLSDVDKAVVVLTLSDFNDRWNKMALGISDKDVPSRPPGIQEPSNEQPSSSRDADQPVPQRR
jgi:hypothetical protein